MAVFITGGLGHVGSWAAYDLAKRGKKVIIFDSAAQQFEQMGLDYLMEVRDNLVLESGDILDFQRLTEVVNRHRGEIEGIIHTVALIATPQFIDNPYRNVSINTMGTLNMLEAARIFGVKKFVNCSSGAVYGDAVGNLSEDTPYKATDLYGATKISSELFALKYGETYEMDVRSVRLYFVYGPGKMPSRMYPLYKGLFGPLEGLSNFTTPNGAEQKVDFTHVRDAAQGVVKVLETNHVENRTFNISSGVAVAMGEIVEAVKFYLGKDTGVSLGPGLYLKRGESLNINRAREEVGYSPEFTDILEGIKDYHNWLVKNGVSDIPNVKL